MKRNLRLSVLFAALAVVLGLAARVKPADLPGYAGDIEKKIDALLARMTLEEKIGQMVQYSFRDTAELKQKIAAGRVGSLLNARGAETTNALQKIAVEKSRLGIPLLFGNDVIHGYKTILPIPLAEAASWDPDLVRQAEAMAAKEARAAGTHWTFGPMVDIARDPRWGRIAEGSGEDPYLGAAMAAAKVLGYQGDSLAAATSVVACPKHYVGYGGAEGGRDYNTVEMSLNTLREVYLPPFRAAVAAGAGTIMSAFNDLNGVPASGNYFTLTQVLRREWGFQGFVVSDWNSIGELVAHGLAADRIQAATAALEAGVDMDMEGDVYAGFLGRMVEEGQLSEKTVDESVRRILRIKLLVGLFDKPYTDSGLERQATLTVDNRALARELAGECIVLLKNEAGLLPLKKDVRSIAVVGPLADDTFAPLGTWACEGRPETVVTVLDGIKSKLPPDVRVSYAKGCDVVGSGLTAVGEAAKIARDADVIVAVLGEPAGWSGEAASRASLDLPGRQEELLRALIETKKPVAVVLMSGRPLAVPWVADNIPAVLEAWDLGLESGNAVADVLFGDVNPGGRLPATFPRAVGQVPLYYNHKNTGRPASPKDKYTSKYIDAPSTPLYPFGYGLSYTKFAYNNLKLSSKTIGTAGRLTVSIDITDTGSRPGDEVVQLYVRDVVASMTRPVKELKGFRRVSLKPGETMTVSFTLGPEHLGFYNRNLDYVVEPGLFQVWVGPNSEEGLTAPFEVR